VPRFSAALFDLDGTLVDSSHELVASVRDALLAVDPREPPDDDTILLEVGKPLETILRELGYPADENTAGRFVDTYRRVFAARLESAPPRLYPHVPETLGLLREALGSRAAISTVADELGRLRLSFKKSPCPPPSRTAPTSRRSASGSPPTRPRWTAAG